MKLIKALAAVYCCLAIICMPFVAVARDGSPIRSGFVVVKPIFGDTSGLAATSACSYAPKYSRFRSMDFLTRADEPAARARQRGR
jgi:hypothetical protein